MEKVGDILGSTLAVFACVTDPEAIVIGGGVSKAGKPLTDCIQKHYQKYAFPSCKSTPIILASLGNDAGIYGAAYGDQRLISDHPENFIIHKIRKRLVQKIAESSRLCARRFFV